MLSSYSTDATPVTTDYNSPMVIRNWLTGFLLLNIIFVVTTLVTDWRTCFYRKASQYKRRVDSAVESRRQLQQKALTQAQIGDKSHTSLKSSVVRDEMDKSILLDNEIEKIEDDLMNGEHSYERSESFKRFVQYEQLQDNIDYDAKEPSTSATRVLSPTIFRRGSKMDKRISLMKSISTE